MMHGDDRTGDPVRDGWARPLRLYLPEAPQRDSRRQIFSSPPTMAAGPKLGKVYRQMGTGCRAVTAPTYVRWTGDSAVLAWLVPFHQKSKRTVAGTVSGSTQFLSIPDCVTSRPLDPPADGRSQ